MSESVLIGNRATNFGGALNSIGSKFTIQRTYFKNNNARAGGTIYNVGGDPDVVQDTIFF